MEWSLAQSRLEEIIKRLRRLQDMLGQRTEKGQANTSMLLLETVDVMSNLVDVTTELLQGQKQIAEHLESHNYYCDDSETDDDMFMMCPHCHARLQRYSPS